MKRKTLLILAVLLTAIACLFTSCSASVEPPKEEEGLAYVTFGNGGSRSLSTEYGIKSYDSLVWYYTAEKKDGFGKTGETRDASGNLAEKAVPPKADGKGIGSGKEGPFSQGAWEFKLYAYEITTKQNESGETITTKILVYQGTSATIVLKGGETKAVPVSVELKGDYGVVDLSHAYFKWAESATSGDGKVYITVTLNGKTDKDASVNKTSLIGPLSKNTENKYPFTSTLSLTGYEVGKIPAGYYTCTVNAYFESDLDTSNNLISSTASPKATQVFGLRVYGNATTYIKGDITENVFTEVEFTVPEQKMVAFTSNVAEVAANPADAKDETTQETKKTTVVFNDNLVGDATRILTLEVTDFETSQAKYTVTSGNSVAGINISLNEITSNETGTAQRPITEFAEDKPVQITTYIMKGLEADSISIIFNGNEENLKPAEFVSYDSTTGEIKFNVYHFSEYYVKANEFEALNVTTNTAYSEFKNSLDKAEKGDTIRLYKDCAYAVNGSDLWDITTSITLDGNGKVLSGWGSRSGNSTTLTINNSGSEMVSVTIKNLTINNNSTAKGRPIETRGNISSLTLENVTINATGSGNNQGITIGGNQSSQAQIKIKNCDITVGNSGYPYISFNPAKVEIEDSTFRGYCSMYFKGPTSSEGSRGTVVTARNSSFDSPNAHSSDGSNDFGVFTFEDGNIQITLEDCAINAEILDSAYQAVFLFKSNSQRKTGISTEITGDKSVINGIVCSVGSSDWTDSSVKLSNGKYDLTAFNKIDGFKHIGYPYSETIHDDIVLTTEGGRYNLDPTNYCKEGFKGIEGSDGYYSIGLASRFEKYENDAANVSLPDGPIVSGNTWTVNPDNAQYTLDGAYGSINGKTIKFSEGTYQTLEFARATKYTGSNTDYYIGGISTEKEKTFEELYSIKNSGTWPASAYYVRNINNVTLIAEDNVSIPNIVASSGHVYGEVYDYVLDKAYTSGSAYYLSQKISNVTIEGFNFTKKVDINTSSADTVIDGVIFKNCKFTTGGTADGNGQGLRYYNESNNGNVKNLTVDTCTFTNCYQGVYTQQINGVKVINSIFNTTGHNAIAIQSGGPENNPYIVNHGQVEITGNTFENVGDRIIRFGRVGADTQITIQNNKATNSGDKDGEVVKATSLAEGASYTISDNRWGAGKKIIMGDTTIIATE